MKFKKLVIVDENSLSEEQKEELKALAEETVIYNDNPKDKKETIKRIGNADAVLVNWTNLDKEILDTCQNLKYLGVVATGYGWLDVPYAISKGIVVTNVPGYATESVAELVFGQLISLIRKSREADDVVRSGRFEQKGLEGEELQGKTIGIIGLGRIGLRVAEIAKGFGMNVIYYSRTRKPNHEKNFKYIELDRLLEESDIVSIHVDSNPTTKDMIGEKEFSKMKNDAVFINMASGDVIDEDALIKYLENGKLKAIIDVYKNHKPKEGFIKNKNVLLTPEIGFFTKEATHRLNDIAIKNARSFLEGNVQNKIVSRPTRQDEIEQEKIESD